MHSYIYMRSYLYHTISQYITWAIDRYGKFPIWKVALSMYAYISLVPRPSHVFQCAQEKSGRLG